MFPSVDAMETACLKTSASPRPRRCCRPARLLRPTPRSLGRPGLPARARWSWMCTRLAGRHRGREFAQPTSLLASYQKALQGIAEAEKVALERRIESGELIHRETARAIIAEVLVPIRNALDVLPMTERSRSKSSSARGGRGGTAPVAECPSTATQFWSVSGIVSPRSKGRLLSLSGPPLGWTSGRSDWWRHRSDRLGVFD
jgi:hypothetical protein